jgi:hypothetical protein
MGYYIETEYNLHKADQLLEAHAEIKEVKQPIFDTTGQTVNVCVVQNGMFDACAVAYNEDEMNAFLPFDGRPKRWLVLPRKLVIELCPSVEGRLAP